MGKQAKSERGPAGGSDVTSKQADQPAKQAASKRANRQAGSAGRAGSEQDTIRSHAPAFDKLLCERATSAFSDTKLWSALDFQK